MVVDNALEILDRNLAKRENEKKERSENRDRKHERFRDLVKRLLDGNKLSAEEGRELYWDVMAQGRALEADPFTGNSQTYYNLGLQRHPRYLVSLAKDISIELFHAMEREAIVRQKKESK
jgi:CCR4-NOT transcriptional regulation complex NOT5 subunit